MFYGVEREREEGREIEKHQCERQISISCLLYVSQLGIEPATFYSVWDDAPINQATRPGLCFHFLTQSEMTCTGFKKLNVESITNPNIKFEASN